MRILQISDTHFGTEVAPVVSALLLAVADLRPQVVVLSGDITQRARRAQFDAARRFMDALPPDAVRIAIPGNHDLPLFDLLARFTAPYAGFSRAFGARETLWADAGVSLLALDATDPRRHKNGALDGVHLARRLADARRACGAGGLLVLIAHQPLWTAWEEDRHETLIGRADTARLVALARVDLVLSGHVHVPLLATSREMDPQLPWEFVLSGAGTAVSHRVRPRAPNSFNLIELRGNAIELARFDYGGIAAGFQLHEACSFVRGPAGWSRQAYRRAAVTPLAQGRALRADALK